MRRKKSFIYYTINFNIDRTTLMTDYLPTGYLESNGNIGKV